jgi:hypothetical protein
MKLFEKSLAGPIAKKILTNLRARMRSRPKKTRFLAFFGFFDVFLNVNIPCFQKSGVPIGKAFSSLKPHEFFIKNTYMKVNEISTS